MDLGTPARRASSVTPSVGPALRKESSRCKALPTEVEDRSRPLEPRPFRFGVPLVARRAGELFVVVALIKAALSSWDTVRRPHPAVDRAVR